MEGFFESSEKLEIYNRAVTVLDDVKDSGLRKRMSEAFGRFKAANREFDKLVREAEQLQLQRCRRSIEMAAEEFQKRGIERVEKGTLMVVAEMLLENNLV